ncbi:hypothetical protein COH67_12685 [Neisseria meningitidis]|nr:hypothetical protein B1A92_10910 [Neisseria meningitidis]RQK41441.1 hypothetical protein COH67_12685 [Neisseria meningitidis]
MKLKKLDSHFRGNDEVEVTRNLKQAKPNEPDSHFRGNDGMQVSVWMDSSFPRRRESRHSMLRQFIGND